MKELSLDTERALFDEAEKMLSDLEILGGEVFSKVIVEDAAFSLCEYLPGETIFTKKEYRKSLSLIIRGRATARKKHGGRDLMIRSFEPGDIFGIATLFCQKDEYVSEIRADSSCVVAFVPQKIVSEVFRESPDAAIAYISVLSQKICFLNDKLDNISAPSAVSKLCYYLLEKQETKVSMQSLAQMLGISRMTLYRSLDILVENEWIRKEGKSLTVLDREALSRVALSEEIF